MTTTHTTPVERAIAAIAPAELTSFLRRQRWFAAKGDQPTVPRIVSVIVTPWGDGQFAIARVEVDVGGDVHLYQLPIAARQSPSSAVAATAVIANLEVHGAPVSIYDAVYDAEFRDGLAKATQTGCTIESDPRVRWIADPIEESRPVAPVNAETRVVSAEQSNTSIVVGDQIILKLFRRLHPGPNPDIEVTRFLTARARFAGAPALFAELRFDDDGIATTSGVAQAYLPGTSDGWTYTLERSRSYFAAPADRDVPNTFVDDAKKLGAITRELHEALASDDDDPDFAPEAVTPEARDRWAHRTQQAIRDSLSLLEQRVSSADFPRDRAPEAQALVRRRDHYLGWIDEIDDQLGDDLGMQTRIHGDLHLGQILRARDGSFKIIDFEGEPSRSLAERREKTSPLRDVAGMLRSFSYAAATLAQTAAKSAPPHVREVRIGRWERDVRAAYLSGYLGETDEPGLLPDEESHTRQLIALFETEKAFYELAYELNHRPAWVWIPMRGIAKLFTKH